MKVIIKKVLFFLLSLCTVLYCSGCSSYTAYKDYYNDICSYEEIWDLSGFRHGYDGPSPLFPSDVEKLDVVDFFCRYDQQLPLGEGIQVYLHIHYEDNEVFQDEVKRISALAFDSTDAFNKTEFSAYSLRLGTDLSSEYAMVDGSNQNIYYIYLQNLPQNEIEFDGSLIPNGYTGYGEVS